MKIPSGDIPVDNLIAANVYLNSFAVLVCGAPIKHLPPLSPLTRNGNGPLLSGTDVGLAGGHAEGVGPLLSSFGVGPADGFGSGSNVSETIGSRTTGLGKGQSAGLNGSKSAIDVVT